MSGKSGTLRGRLAGLCTARSWFHVPVELLRSWRISLGSVLDGPCGDPRV